MTDAERERLERINAHARQLQADLAAAGLRSRLTEHLDGDAADHEYDQERDA